MSEISDRFASGFRAELIAAPQVNANPGAVIRFDTVRWNRLGEYNPVTGLFTAREAGYYVFNASVSYTDNIVGLTGIFLAITVTGVADVAAEDDNHNNGEVQRRTLSAIVYLTPGQSVSVREAHAAAGNITIRNDARFTAFLGYRLD